MNVLVKWFKKLNPEVVQPKRGHWQMYERGAALFNEDGMRLVTVRSPEIYHSVFYSVLGKEFDTLENAKRWVEKYYNINTSMELG